MDHFLKGMCLFIAYIPTNHRSILALPDCEGFWRGKQLLLKKRNNPPGSRTCPSEAQAAHPHRQRSSSPPAHENIDLKQKKHLKVSVEKLVQLKVVIILSKGIVESLSNPEPSKNEEESKGHEDRVVEVDLLILPLEVLVARNYPLLSKKGGSKIDIDGQMHNLLGGE